MKVHFKAKVPKFGRGKNKLSLSYQQRSPYYWWWEFLRRNEEYRQCCLNGGKGELSDLYADFGVVLHDNFKEWWTEDERGRRLFGERPLLYSLREVADLNEWDDSRRNQNVTLLQVPLNMSKRYLQSSFNAFLKKRHDTQRGRQKKTDLNASTAKYPLHRHVSIETLMIQLAVYDAVMAKKRGEHNKTYIQIANELRIIPKARSKDAEAEGRDVNQIIYPTISRYFKDACNIIANTAKGQFPNSDMRKKSLR
jgi:hypothetical protein